MQQDNAMSALDPENPSTKRKRANSSSPKVAASPTLKPTPVFPSPSAASGVRGSAFADEEIAFMLLWISKGMDDKDVAKSYFEKYGTSSRTRPAVLKKTREVIANIKATVNNVSAPDLERSGISHEVNIFFF